MTLRPWCWVYRAIVRAARFDAADLRTHDAELTFMRVLDGAARRGGLARTSTAIRELSVIAGVIALAYLRRVPAPRRPRVVDLLRGLRIAVRSLFRSHRGYVTMSTFVLSVAVGVNLLVFTIVNALWIRPLPFPEPEKVATIQNDVRGSLDDTRLRIFEGGVAGQVVTTDEYGALHPRIELIGRYPETLGVTSGYFKVLALRIRGRDFTADDEREGAEPVAIISDRLWSAAFGRRHEVIGSVVEAQPFPIRVVGVAPPDFEGARRGERADMWVPLGVVNRLAPADWKGRRLPQMVFARVGPQQTVAMMDQRYWELTDVKLREFYQQLQIRMDLRPRVVSVAGVFGTLIRAPSWSESVTRRWSSAASRCSCSLAAAPRLRRSHWCTTNGVAVNSQSRCRLAPAGAGSSASCCATCRWLRCWGAPEVWWSRLSDCESCHR